MPLYEPIVLELIPLGGSVCNSSSSSSKEERCCCVTARPLTRIEGTDKIEANTGELQIRQSTQLDVDA
jgi:hypothetical protein